MSKGMEATMTDAVDWRLDICKCGCSKGWHSLSSRTWIPAASGCMSGADCGCKQLRPSEPTLEEKKAAVLAKFVDSYSDLCDKAPVNLRYQIYASPDSGEVIGSGPNENAAIADAYARHCAPQAATSAPEGVEAPKEDEIKPCPFCGRDAYLHGDLNGGHAVSCRGHICGAFISGTPIHPALKRWNTRVEPEPKGFEEWFKYNEIALYTRIETGLATEEEKAFEKRLRAAWNAASPRDSGWESAGKLWDAANAVSEYEEPISAKGATAERWLALSTALAEYESKRTAPDDGSRNSALNDAVNKIREYAAQRAGDKSNDWRAGVFDASNVVNAMTASYVPAATKEQKA